VTYMASNGNSTNPQVFLKGGNCGGEGTLVEKLNSCEILLLSNYKSKCLSLKHSYSNVGLPQGNQPVSAYSAHNVLYQYVIAH